MNSPDQTTARDLVVGNSAPVFHRAAKPAGNGELVQLRQWIRDAEVFVIVMQNLSGELPMHSERFRLFLSSL